MEPHAADGKSDALPLPVLMKGSAEEIGNQPCRRETKDEKE